LQRFQEDDLSYIIYFTLQKEHQHNSFNIFHKAKRNDAEVSNASVL
jgi:hypothetical protein